MINPAIIPDADPSALQEFAVHSEPMVRKLIQTVLDDEHEVYVFVHPSDQYFVSEVLGIDWKSGFMWLGTPYEKGLVQNCGAQTPYTLVSFPDGVKIQFSGLGLLRQNYEGADAIQLKLPKSVVRLQRRNYFRVMADSEINRQVKVEIPGLAESPSLLDISLAGCGLLMRHKPEFAVGQEMRNVRLSLPDGEPSMLVRLEIKNSKPTQDDPDMVQLGCEMSLLERGGERRLQRYLLSCERRLRTVQQLA
ncbi:MAG: flagellar brake protein [Limnobacter sp.]|uniref:flagellar brake protein n=1 Tax=Limnobacter sp. TaxID=2003368 RepID=UPI003918E11E